MAQTPNDPDLGSSEDGDEQTVSWRALLGETEERLRGAVPDPEVSARRIVEEASGMEGVELTVGLDTLATVGGVRRLDAMVARRQQGEPLQYVLGHWAFRSLDLMVDGRVLIPRPETEVVAGVALDELRQLPLPSGRTAPVAVDLGTGSGALGLALAFEAPGTEVWLTDMSADALDVARANLAGLGRRGVGVRVVEGSWFAALPSELAGQVSLIVSNPPYVAPDEELPDDVLDWEPSSALFAEAEGYAAYEVVLGEAQRWLAPGGAVVVECAPWQVDSLLERAEAAGFGRRRPFTDLTGNPRGIVAGLEH